MKSTRVAGLRLTAFVASLLALASTGLLSATGASTLVVIVSGFGAALSIVALVAAVLGEVMPSSRVERDSEADSMTRSSATHGDR